MVEKGGVSKDLDNVFEQRQKIGYFATSANSNFISWKSHKQPWEAASLHNSQQRKRSSLGIDLILGIIPFFRQLNFDLTIFSMI
jgi:hypothetical protein